MYKQNRKLIIFILALLLSAIVNAAVVTRSETVENSSVSSNIPYSLHYKKFQKDTVDLFKNLNLSKYGDMYLFVGYGFSDKKEQNCYFVDNAANKNILTDFDKPITRGKKTYLVSRRRMTYADCKSLSNKYAGYVYNPINISDDSTIKALYYDKDFWIGIFKNNCSEDWINQYNFHQEYNKITDKKCYQDKLNIFSVVNSYNWKEDSGNNHHYCLLQIDSKDYLRPIKVCAPWWQIEQTYPLKTSRTVSNLAPFFNIVVPKKMSVCVDLNSSQPVDYEKLYNDKSKWVKYDCTSYYSIKAGDSCMENLLQDQCKVDECKGQVEDQCELVSTFSSKTKDYEIGTVAGPDGTFKTIKVKDKIKTSEYLCPPPRPSIADCKEYINVTVMPTDACNPGGCDKYFNCLNKHPHNVKYCDSLVDGCERHYGNSFIIDSVNKKVRYAMVKCNDSTASHPHNIKNYNINMISRSKSQCTSYTTITKYKTKDESCTVDKPKHKFSVTASLTEPDIYMGKNNCVRINNSGSNVQNNYQLSFNASKFFNTKISKVSNSLKPGDINGTTVDPEKIVEVLQNGKVKITNIKNGTATSIDTLDSLSKAFNSVDSMIVGSDTESEKLADVSFFSTDNNKSAAINKYAKDTTAKFITGPNSGNGVLKITQKEPKYKYFTKRWFEKRILVFDDDALSSITRPYSAFAQCLDIPLDKTKSKYGSPFPIYHGKGSRISPKIVRENYENSKYMETYTDKDVMSKGLYCKRENNAKNIDWFGTNSSDLYFNSYSCSRLYNRMGKVWVVPTKKRFYAMHSAKNVNGTSKKRIGSVYDYTLPDCEDGYELQGNGKCKKTTIESKPVTFNVAGVTSATVTGGADDAVEIIVNGHVVYAQGKNQLQCTSPFKVFDDNISCTDDNSIIFKGEQGAYTSFDDKDFKQYLKVGKNTITTYYEVTGGGHGFATYKIVTSTADTILTPMFSKKTNIFYSTEHKQRHKYNFIWSDPKTFYVLKKNPSCTSPYNLNSSKTKCIKTIYTYKDHSCKSTYKYDSSINKCKKLKTFNYYEYLCPNGYVPKDKGFTTYSRKDNDINNPDNLNVLSKAVNNNNPPSGNCYAGDSLSKKILKNSTSDLSLIKYDTSKNRYCKRITQITTGNIKDYADYNCSKYYNSNGEWAYNKKTYYMYNANGYKYFRQKFCGNGDYNKNQVDKDGKNALMLSFTSNEDFINFLKNDSSTSAYRNQFLNENNQTFKIPQIKLNIDNVKRDIIVKKVIDKTLEPMDSKFEVFRKDGKLHIISIDAMSSLDCKKYAKDFNLTQHDVETKQIGSKCEIIYDYFDIDNPKDIPFTPLHTNFTKGNFNFKQTGFNSILTVESYINGHWGYSTNYVSPPFIDGNVSINNKIIYPILSESKDLTVSADVQLDRTIYQKTITTRKKIVPDPAAFKAAGIAALSCGSSMAIAGMAAVGPFSVLSGIGVMATTYVINLFGGRKKYAYEKRSTELYMDKNKYPYYPNIYGYDKRINLQNKMLTYTSNFISGTQKKSKEKEILSKYATLNKNIMVNTYGLDKNSYDSAMKGADSAIIAGWPGLKWYKNGPKKRTRNYAYNDTVKKVYNSVFYGATNELTIFLPFKADYEIMAISEKGNILGKRIIYADNYIQTASAQDYQQVFFGLDKNFNIASGLDYGKTDKACLYSNVLEWGGGVSGGYYSFGTPKGYTCQKSNDTYVKDNSARFIAVRKVGDSDFNIIKLQKPMPYANKIFVTTLGKLETRDYMCYDDANCTVK